MASKLDQQDLPQLMRAIEKRRHEDSSCEFPEIPSDKKDEIRKRFNLIDNNETQLSSWSDVKDRVFRK